MFLLTGLRPRNADEFNLNQSARILHMLAFSLTLYIYFNVTCKGEMSQIPLVRVVPPLMTTMDLIIAESWRCVHEKQKPVAVS